eukprot:scaffold1018_cov420-Prasinococcus_capsulatus_cf.AAC.10
MSMCACEPPVPPLAGAITLRCGHGPSPQSLQHLALTVLSLWSKSDQAATLCARGSRRMSS